MNLYTFGRTHQYAVGQHGSTKSEETVWIAANTIEEALSILEAEFGVNNFTQLSLKVLSPGIVYHSIQ